MTDPTVAEPSAVQMSAWVAEFLAVSQQALEVAAAHQNAQPDRITAARERAQAERDRAVSEQPWNATLEVVPQVTRGDLAGLTAHAPPEATELWGRRAALELVVNGQEDPAAALHGVFGHIPYPGHALLVATEAALHLAVRVVPTLLAAAEGGPDFVARAALAEALANAWADRVGQQEGREGAHSVGPR